MRGKRSSGPAIARDETFSAHFMYESHCVLMMSMFVLQYDSSGNHILHVSFATIKPLHVYASFIYGIKCRKNKKIFLRGLPWSQESQGTNESRNRGNHESKKRDIQRQDSETSNNRLNELNERRNDMNW